MQYLAMPSPAVCCELVVMLVLKMHISRMSLLKQVTIYTNNEIGITSYSYCYTFKPDRMSYIDGMTLSFLEILVSEM